MVAKKFKLFADNGIEKNAPSHYFKTIVLLNTIFTYTMVTFPELVGANMLNKQHSMKG